MVYITNSSEKQIINKLAKLVYVEPSNFDLEYKSKIEIFSYHEEKWLISIKDLFINFNFYIDKYFKKIQSQDTHSYIREGSTPAYHNSHDCDYLNADYKNYAIPAEIQAKGDDFINKYRQWFIQHEHLIHSNPQSFKIKLEASFFIRNPKSIDEITHKNTGSTSYENLNLEDIENKIDTLVAKAEKFREKTSENRITIKENGNILKISVDNHDKKLILEHWQYLKKEIKRNLINYYTIKYSPDLDFKGNLLERLGFKQCNHCKKVAIK